MSYAQRLAEAVAQAPARETFHAAKPANDPWANVCKRGYSLKEVK